MANQKSSKNMAIYVLVYLLAVAVSAVLITQVYNEGLVYAVVISVAAAIGAIIGVRLS